MTLEQRQQRDLVLYSPSNCAKHSHKIKTIKDVLSLPSKTLGDFKGEYGKEWVIGYISMWLIELNDNSNVKTKMTDAQMEFTATRIYESYSLKVTDLTLFFRNIKEGVYGQFYENLSQEKIMEWLSQYFDLRCEYGQMQSQSMDDDFSLTKDAISPEVAKEMFKGVGEEKVEYNHEKNGGLGSRIKKVITIDLPTKIKEYTTDELKEYLINNDVDSKNYDEFVYKLIEKELDERNKPKPSETPLNKKKYK